MRLLALLAVPAALVAASFYGDKPLPVRGGAVSSSRIEPRFGRVASSLAGRPTEVRCWSQLDWARINGDFLARAGPHESLDHVAGFYWPATRRVHLDPTACAGLVDLAYRHARPGSGRPFDRIALGVETLAHESMHRRGFSSEAVAECYAVQLAYRTATALGSGARYGARISQHVWERYPEHPQQYLSGECRDGGKLDLAPGRRGFP